MSENEGPNPRFIQSLNSWACLVLGTSANLFLIWLIKNKGNGRELCKWRWILWQTCIIDIFYTLATFITEPIFLFESSSGNRIIVLNIPFGIAQMLPSLAGFILFYVQNALSILMVAGIGAQFLCRYLALCRKIWLNIKTYFLLLAAILFWIGLYIFVCVLAEYVPTGTAQFVQDPSIIRLLNGPQSAAKSNDAEQMIKVAVSRRNNVSEQALFWQSCLDKAQYSNQLVPFCITCFCAWRIRRHIVDELGDANSKRQREINVQLTFTLMAQALIPAILFIFYTFILANVFEGNAATIQSFKMYSQLPNSWLSLWNPLITVAAIRPFRRFVLNKLRGIKFVQSSVEIPHSAAVGIVQPQTNQNLAEGGNCRLAWQSVAN